MRTLIVEDDVRMAAAIRRALRGAGVVADVTGNGADAQWMATASAYDVIVLDVTLPDVDGFDTCVQLRRTGVWTPIIMVTARDAVRDRVRGLDAGADDYLIKPFSLEELLARLRALARREGVERPTVVVVGTLRLDPATRRVWRGDTEIELSAKEFALLHMLAGDPLRVFTKEELLRDVWGFKSMGSTRTLDSHASRLRRKLSPRSEGRRWVVNVWGVGYRLTDPDS